MKSPGILKCFVILLMLMGPGHSEAKKYRIAMLVPEADSPFWHGVHAGAIKAQRESSNAEINLELLWLSPKHPNSVDEEVNLMGDIVGSNVDGIDVAALDPHALVPPIELATRQKIPVLAMEFPIDYPLITSTVATSNYQCGAEAAIITGRLLQDSGKVLMVRYVRTNPATRKREDGFLDGVRKYCDSLQIIAPDDYSGPSEAEAYTLAKRLISSHATELSAVFTSDPVTTQAVQQVLVDLGMSQKIKQVGFLIGNEGLKAIQSGSLAGVISPDPFSLGYLSVKATLAAIRGQVVQPRINIPEAAVTPQNLNSPEVQAILLAPVDEYLHPK